MSRFGLRVALVALTAAWAAPAAHAQSLIQERARVAALAARLHTLEGRADSARRLEDTIAVGGLRVVAKHAVRRQVEEATRRALSELQRRLGPEDVHLLDGLVITQARDGWPDSYGLQGAVADVVQAVGAQLAYAGGATLRSWVDWWNVDSRELQATYLALVTSPAVAATRCFEGDTRWCAKILGLDSVADPWTELFDAAGRRTMIARRWRWLSAIAARVPVPTRYAEEVRLFRECVDGRVDDACVALLRTQPRPAYLLLSSEPARSVVLVARTMGGDGALTRLMADTAAPLGDRLAATAGVPLDSLLTVWHARVIEAEPVRTQVGPTAAWISFFAIIVAGAFAMRSTRWRLG